MINKTKKLVQCRICKVQIWVGHNCKDPLCDTHYQRKIKDQRNLRARYRRAHDEEYRQKTNERHRKNYAKRKGKVYKLD